MITVTTARLWLGAIAVMAAATCPAAAADPPGRMKLEKLDGKFRVTVGGELFCEYVYQGYAKPIVYPIYGPGQVPMTRNYPMRPGVKGEATDHPHHKSLWFAHGNVNGTSFWLEQGRIVQERIVRADHDPQRPSITTDNRWIDRRGKTACTDTTTVAFLEVAGGRAIDYDVTIHASQGDVTFGDTKEGLMAIRTHPSLQLANLPDSGVTTANGQAINSRGVRGKAVWGQRADWIDYFGHVEGRLVGVAIFDHPANFRHPTYWHAREYGLIAANPFGVSDFTHHEETGGAVKLAAGRDMRFRYRFVFHRGDATDAKIADLYAEYCRGENKLPRPNK